MNEVENLRKGGYKVRVMHHRLTNLEGIKARGGRTVVEVTTPEGITLVGMARCSRNENFNKRLGVRIALGRAFASVQNKGAQDLCREMELP